MKKLYTREEFETCRADWASEMSADTSLQSKALELYNEAHKYNWIHQTTWLGEPSLLTANDLVVFQEIIFKTKPDYIIELGVAWGGSLLFFASMLQLIGGNKVIGVDTYMPEDLKERLVSFKDMYKKIKLINASSTAIETVKQVESILGGSKKVLIHFDSNHSHVHVLDELNLYEKFVEKSFYLVCGSTIIEKLPAQTHRVRPWGIGDNAKTALDEFLKLNNRFVVDESIKDKLLISNQADGYLKCIKS